MKYYNNIECEVIAELPDNESVIKFTTGYYNENEYMTPIEASLVVNNKQLTDKPVTKDQITKEREQLFKELSLEKSKMLLSANKEIREEREKLSLELKDIKKELETLYEASIHAKTYEKLKNDDYNYVVSYFKIMTIDEFKKDYRYKSTCEDYPAFDQMYFRIADGRLSFHTRLGGYTYYLYDSLDKAKQKLTELYNDKLLGKSMGINVLNELDTWGIKIDDAESKRKAIVEKHNADIYKSIENYEKNIESAKNNLIL